MKFVLPTLALFALAALFVLNSGSVERELELATAATQTAAVILDSENTDAPELIEPEPASTQGAETRSDATVELIPAELVASGEVFVREPDGSLTRGANGTIAIRVKCEATITVPASGESWPAPANRLEKVTVTNGRFELRYGRNEHGIYVRAGEEPSEPATEPVARGLLQTGKLEGLVTPTTELEIRGVKLLNDDGRLEVQAEHKNFSFGETNVRAVFRRRELFRLSVRDGNHGQHISAVTIFEASGASLGELPPEGSRGTLAAGSPSPLLIDPAEPGALTRDVETSRYRYSARERGLSANYARFGRPGTRWFVGSLGYAWQLAEFPLTEGGEHEVRLEPGGDLEVRFSGIEPPADAYLRIRPKLNRSAIADRAVSKVEHLSFEGLQLGEHELSIEVGDPFETPYVLAEATVQITAGATKRVTLNLQHAPQVQLAPLSGTLVLPTNWDEPKFWLSLSLLDVPLDGSSGHHSLSTAALKPLAGSETTYAFDFGEIQAGRYALKLSPLSYGIVFELNSYGNTGLSLRIPDLVDISVALQDQATGTVADTNTLTWTSNHSPDAIGRFTRRASRESGEPEFRIRVPRGPFTVTGATNHFRIVPQTVHAEAGARFVLDIEPTQ